MRNVRGVRGTKKENPDFCLGLASRPASRQTQYKLGRSPNPLLFWETPNKSPAAHGGSFAPTVQFENLEIHKVFLRLSNLHLVQNFLPSALADFSGASRKGMKQ